MSQRQIPTLAGIFLSDTGSSPNTAVERDASNDVYANSFRGDGPAFIGAAIYGDVSVSKTANFAADDSKNLWRVSAAGGAVTVTLPAAATVPNLILSFKKTDNSNNVIVDGNGAETIDGAATKTLTTQYAAITIQCDGTGWHILNQMGTIT